MVRQFQREAMGVPPVDLAGSAGCWTATLKRELVDRTGDIEAQSEPLFHALFVVVSQADSDDPVVNYVNRQALDLWEMDWAEFTAMPTWTG